MYHRTPKRITSESDYLKSLRDRFHENPYREEEGRSVLNQIRELTAQERRRVQEMERYVRRMRKEVREMRQNKEALIAVSVVNGLTPLSKLEDATGLSKKTLYNIRDRFLTSQGSTITL